MLYFLLDQTTNKKFIPELNVFFGLKSAFSLTIFCLFPCTSTDAFITTCFVISFFFKAWTGDFCTEDVDGCTELACFANAPCIDAPAPMIGAMCPDCPAGYIGDGQKCFGLLFYDNDLFMQ